MFEATPTFRFSAEMVAGQHSAQSPSASAFWRKTLVELGSPQGGNGAGKMRRSVQGIRKEKI
jgi:hypothetical protein